MSKDLNLHLNETLDHLDWVLQSPPMLSDNTSLFETIPGPSQAEQSIVREQARLNLLQHLAATKSHFLGSYFESLWGFYLKHSPRYELLAANEQIHYEGRTLGELDFLVYDKELDTPVHQEVAIKFYLGHKHNSQTLWIGPNSIDRLDLKVGHLQTHQLTLTQHPETQKRLKERFGISSLRSAALIKGYLFQPWQQTLRAPDYVNSKHLSGDWLHYHHTDAFLDQHNPNQYLWYELTKPAWLTCQPETLCDSHTEQEISDIKSFLTTPENQNRSRLVGRLDPSTRILEKIFFVPSGWPGSAHTPPAL